MPSCKWVKLVNHCECIEVSQVDVVIQLFKFA